LAISKSRAPQGFARPTDLPRDAEEEGRWQEANRTWWESHPMRYDWKEQVGHPEFSREFFEEIDRRFFSSAAEYMPWSRIPFDPLIDFESLRAMDVLEIGVGNGSHAALLARHARSFTGIDLTDYAVTSTRERFRHFDLAGRIERMDAERMEFADESFDLIWTWGVIHHSSNTKRILQEMRRVLRLGGKATTMVYYRNLWNYYVAGGFFHGLLKGDLFRTRSLNQTVQRYTDGAIARYYSIPEWKELVSEFFRVERVLVFGSKPEILPIPGGRLKSQLLKLIPNSASRFLTNRLRLGQFLVSDLRR
jgi:ubiquinone/menaquinone biosynthesis C-methylase UbiE